MVQPQCDVSVFIPAYNASRFIAKAVESVLAQTYPHFELIVVDNASDDDTVEIVRSYAQRDERVRLLCNETNLGFQRSVNRALNEVQCELVTKLDAPDWMPSDRLAVQKRYLDENPDVAVVGGNVEFYNEQYLLMYCHDFSAYYLPVELLFDCFLSHSAVMYRKSIVMTYGGYDEGLVRAEDYDLWMKILSDGHRMENLDQVMSCELVFKGQGADFMQKEEYETVRQAQQHFIEKISNDPEIIDRVEVLVDIANNRLHRPVEDEVFRYSIHYLTSTFLLDLKAHYPYAINALAVQVVERRVADFIGAHLVGKMGVIAREVAKENGMSPNSIWTFANIRRAIRSQLGGIRHRWIASRN